MQLQQYIISYLTGGNNGLFVEDIAAIKVAKAAIKAAEAAKAYHYSANAVYCTFGAASAVVPYREINTYLASELFERFSCICQNVPTQADVEKLAVSALARDAQSISDIYNSPIMNCARDLTIAMLHMLMIGSSSEIMATKKWLPATQIKQPQS